MNENQNDVLYKIESKEICPSCGADLIIKSSQHGPFLGCSNYPQCEYIQPLKERQESQILKELTDKSCQECQSHLVVRQGKFGLFICCVNYPACHYIAQTAESPKGDKNVSSPYANKTAVTEIVDCPKCQKGQLIARQSRFGKTFWGCSAYPKCDYLVNLKPIKAKCPKCQNSLLVEKKRSKGTVFTCANKKCDFETDSWARIETK